MRNIVNKWDDPNSDPIGDMQRFFEKIRNEAYKPRHNCEVDGHILRPGNLCIVCFRFVDSA